MGIKENILLSVENLAVSFRSGDGVARAVDGVSFEIRKGETVCIVGESGCGKTVSALSILGLVPSPPGEITAGRILFHGENLLDLDEENLRMVRGKKIAMVFQEPLTALNPVFTIGDQIAEAIEIHEPLPRQKVFQRCVELLKDAGIASPEERMKDYPHQLSGGQRQRVMIAMALSCWPELLIADEPTTALDVTIQAQILQLLRSLQKKHATSVLYITHDLAVVSHIATRIYVMYAGMIVEQGTTTQIFKSPKHPYTQGLLASLPSRMKRGERLPSIPGTVPDPSHRPTGCSFHPRCIHAVDSCRNEFPSMCDYGDRHFSRCPVLFEENSMGGTHQ
ncbi:MAG: ABC transporter ATP-binding protein [Deltaproteobacteria bacterium]|nr:MAG: ABC transporter ATP-binding protein [Deltaproteobacteria bacterium]